MGQFEIGCQCAGRPLAPGQSGCMPQAKRDKFPIFMYKYGSDGSRNSIPAGTVLNQTYITNKLNAALDADRWWIFPEMFGLEEPGAENETEDIDGVAFPTGEENKQPWTWFHGKKNYNPALKAAYASFACEEIMVMFITYAGQVSGISDGTGGLTGIDIEGGSIFATPSRAVKGATGKLMVQITEDSLVNPADYDHIEAESIAYSALNWYDLQPIELILTEISQSGQDTLVFRANYLYGNANFKKPYTGLLTADVSPDNGSTTGEVYNQTDDLNAAGVLSESSSTPGLYTWTFNDYQHAGDVCKLDLFKTGISSRGLEFTIETS